MTKKVAVILAGCGYLDGAEIREAVLALYFLDKEGADVRIFAPDITQHDTINHFTLKPVEEKRSVLEESARIARSEIKDVLDLRVADFDALVLPGGFGVAKSMSDFATNGANIDVQEDYQRVIREFNEKKKPIGAICIAPAIVVGALKKGSVTIGDDAATAEAIVKMGGKHVNAGSTEICIDENEKIVSTSAYMRDDKLSLIGQGIEKLVQKVLELA